ncbi:ATP synthase mitochondrial F1 complex assembly factor 2 isoform X3 [Lemur catta]|uniref:ATP synthase mitochondrial F1 complex assembly factor 2 isoform X3 n=1 Tax=Lemur catta TaxID=9447 RepID=UPI001E26D7E5|nr:ATP synthase mitochondrial F1 complex assembly factor 2 isoform X3 [Lemur catta]
MTVSTSCRCDQEWMRCCIESAGRGSWFLSGHSVDRGVGCWLPGHGCAQPLQTQLGFPSAWPAETTLCNTSLDNPTQRNKDQLIRAAVKFLDTDTICYRVEEPETLVELQKNEWDPIIAWAEKRYSMEIGSSTSIMGPSIPAKTREVLVNHLASYNMWALQGIEFIVTQLKSMVLTLGLIDLHLTVEQAVLLSRLEEEYQIQKWGNIEWAHDYELQELRARTAAGALFVHLCSESTTVKHKLLQD